jgi:hypothetical protein
MNNATNFDIYYQSMDGSNGALVVHPTPLEFEYQPDVDGLVYVWTHNTTKTSPVTDIQIWDLSKNPAAFYNVASGTQTDSYTNPAINANMVVYERQTNGSQWDIEGWNYAHLAPIGNFPVGSTHITNDQAAQHNPRVSGDFVVFESYDDPADPTGTVPRVMGCHITPNADNTAWTCPINPIASAMTEPDVDSTNVVFIGKDAAGWPQVYLYDGSSGNSTSGSIRPLTNFSSKKHHPRISGSHVVWVDERTSPGKSIYSFDLITNIEDKVAGGSTNCDLPAIDGNRVAYTVDDPTTTGVTDVWVFTYAPRIQVPQGIVDCPANSTLEDGPYTLKYTGATVTSSNHTFPTADPKKTYYFCIDNGRSSDGKYVATNGAVLIDASISVISTKEFAAEANASPPVLHYAKAVDITTGRSWAASLYSPQTNPSMMAVSLRSVPATATTSTASQ